MLILSYYVWYYILDICMSNAGFIPYGTIHFDCLLLDLSYIWYYTLRILNAGFILYGAIHFVCLRLVLLHMVLYTSSV